ncbi:MAG: GatB/YqeY domain-containing protein [Rhodocyclaceae bacterium]|nr:GatB/YqeY domain-containing protein [Rhodocyclaceae bacterium]
MSLKARITDDMKTAMKAKETAKLGAIRLLLAALKQKEVDERVELDDNAVIAIIEKLTKQRKDSFTQYEAAGRQELADAEKFEIAVLGAYLPEKMSTEETNAIVLAAAAEIGANGEKLGPADMGKLMAVLKPRLAGKADMAEVSKLVKAALQ